MKPFALILIFLAILAGGYAASTLFSDPPADTPQPEAGRYMDIESYVRTAISELSPIKEQVGGTFYVTMIETEGGAGIVSYEDGHNAYTADFTYHVTAEGQPVVDSFVIRADGL